jgi:hypothetical protein
MLYLKREEIEAIGGEVGMKKRVCLCGVLYEIVGYQEPYWVLEKFEERS